MLWYLTPSMEEIAAIYKLFRAQGQCVKLEYRVHRGQHDVFSQQE